MLCVDVCLLLLCITICVCKLLLFGWHLIAVVVDVCGCCLSLVVDVSYGFLLCVVCVRCRWLSCVGFGLCLSFDVEACLVLAVCCWLSLCVVVQCSRVRLCWCMLLLLFVGCCVSSLRVARCLYFDVWNCCVVLLRCAIVCLRCCMRLFAVAVSVAVVACCRCRLVVVVARSCVLHGMVCCLM